MKKNQNSKHLIMEIQFLQINFLILFNKMNVVKINHQQ